MSKIRIKNFGPIKSGYPDNDGWIEIEKVTFFIGNQGSGKSTIAKLISTFTWLEKALTRGDFEIKDLEKKDVLSRYLKYHKIEDYFNYKKPSRIKEHDISEISYVGDSYSFTYHDRKMKIEEVPGKDYFLPQIMYVPADRNFLSSIEDRKSQRVVSPALRELLDEIDKAQREMKEDIDLPINDAKLEYDRKTDTLLLKGEGYVLNLSHTSSGFQSFVPLFLTTRYLTGQVNRQSENPEPMNSEELNRFRQGLADIYSNPTLTGDQRRIAISTLSSKFNKSAFINIVEEPEQNLFPISQWEMLKSLLEFNNSNKNNKLIVTTHSPYLLNYLSIAVEAGNLKGKIEDATNSNGLESKLAQIISLDATIKEKDLVIYELNEINGTIQKLANTEGVPSDKNYLNAILRKGNSIFDSLLALEEEL